jgi:hypothetical protein
VLFIYFLFFLCAISSHFYFCFLQIFLSDLILDGLALDDVMSKKKFKVTKLKRTLCKRLKKNIPDCFLNLATLHLNSNGISSKFSSNFAIDSKLNNKKKFFHNFFYGSIPTTIFKKKKI